ncbi:hypothetical protein [Ferrimonas lipolytica]|uniref:Uncharacterized protein n=1 Tax=Ferrimonas lipolytica TaxID=2724191 RepID=A0A6H1UBC4_9GAMM|nr:hypothetical protein [Ferrimonas lipolytica]QIZ76344.1 hypothetical protein HER31_05355 [Ferrimonas lipolytica]
MTLPSHIAQLPLADNHNHYFSIANLVEQATHLAQQGSVEIHLIDNNGSGYNDNQQHQQTALFSLCQQLAQLGVWIRLPLCLPSTELDELLPLLVTGQVLPYFELNYIHASPELLPQHHPSIDINTLDQLDYWREQCPDLVVVGHLSIGDDTPGQFELMQDWLAAAQLDRVEIATRGEATIANLRQGQLQQLQEPISASKNYNRVEDELLVLIDEIGEDGAIGRYFGQSYGLGKVIVGGEYDVNVGDFIWVAIEFADHENLYGVLLEDE